MSEFHAEAPQATANEELVKGSYVAPRAEFKPVTLRTKGDESTNEPPRSIHLCWRDPMGVVLENEVQCPDVVLGLPFGDQLCTMTGCTVILKQELFTEELLS